MSMIPKEQHNEVATNMLPLAKSLASEFSQKHHAIDYDSALSAASLGLVKALESFDASTGDGSIRFRTYAFHRMRGQILDDIRSNSPHPRLVLERNDKDRAVADRFYKEHGRPMTPEELEAATDHNAKYDDTYVSFTSTERLIRGEGKPMRVRDSLADRSLPIGSGQSALDTLRAITHGMPRRDILVFKLYFIEQMTMQEISRVVGVTESRVSQIVSNALPTLRDRYEELFAEAV